MPAPPKNETWKQRVSAVVEIVRNGLPQFIGFELLFGALGLAAFTPITAWLMTRLIEWSGDGAISNYDLAGFLLSGKGFAFLTTIVSIGFTLVFFEIGGLLALAISLLRGEHIRLPQLFRFLGISLPRLWRLAVRQFLIYLLFAIPCLAATGCAYLAFLTKNDINYYLIAKPPLFWLTVGIAAVSTLVWVFFAARCFVDWIHSVPLLLFTSESPVEALRESKRLVENHRPEVVFMLLRWLAAIAILLAGFWIVMFLLKWMLFGMAGENIPMVLTMTALLAVAHFLGNGMIAIVAMASLACAEARLFMRVRPEVSLPESLIGHGHELLRRVSAFLRAGWAIVLIACVLAGFAAMRILENIQYDDSVGISAHRGSSITAPENTMAAIMLAVEEGADYVEIDVQETRDGTVVLVHDKDLKRVFDIDKGIWEVSYDELRDLDSGGWFSAEFGDQRLATLDQVIKAVKGKAKLNIELKFNGHQKQLASEVVRIVRENDFADQCILTSLDYAGIRRARAAGPGIRTGLIVTSAIGDITTFDGELLSVSAKAVDRDLIKRARLKGLEVHVWTVNDVATMNTMIGMGVDNIITDNPKLLRELLLERSKLSNSEKLLLQLADIGNRRF